MERQLHAHAKRDYAADRRLVMISAMAVAIGACSAIAADVLLKLIRFFTNLFFFQRLSLADAMPAHHTLGAWVIALPVIGGLLVGLMARYGSEKIRGHGIPEAIEAILFGKSRMSPKVALLKPISSGIVIGSGGPFGAEGPIIMTGGSLGSLIAQFFHLTAAERKTLLVAGACAGMTAIFGTPVAALLLAVELMLFEFRPRSLLPVAVACAVAGFLRPLLFEAGPLFPIDTAPATLPALASCIAAGLACGLLSSLLTHALYRMEDLFAKLPLHWMWWPALGGLAVGIGGYFEPRALGVGYDVIGDLLSNHMALAVALSLLGVKALMWIVALGSGTSGGVLAPLLMMGAGLGVALAPVLPGATPSLWALVCMAGVLGGVLGAPLTAIVFAFGLTHDSNALLPLLLTTAVSYGFNVLTMRRSIMTEKIARRGLHIYREYGVDPLERQHVSDLMTRAVMTIPADLPVGEAILRYFGTDQPHRCYPMLSEGRLAGMIERGTLMDAPASATSCRDLAPRDREPVVALAEESVRIVAARMAAYRLERLPVVETRESMRLIGIISRSDILKSSEDVFADELVRERMR
ncbi:chloride channel protein [Noviherbaspirillum autotrophicum]|uniref:Chloride channel protein n=1 Tax=Noviherbaspirillum autotrophicum TaxID=709839 RepID=A0A0C2BQJ8_9BURK|nr:chloride channel protein [Noviherbaspirillum autotrophicum]